MLDVTVPHSSQISGSNIETLLKVRDDIWNLYTMRFEKSRAVKYGSIVESWGRDVSLPQASIYLVENGLAPAYPEDRRFAVCLTHDIDEIYPPVSHMLLSSLHCLGRVDLNGINRQLAWRYKGKKYSPYLNFKKIMRLEEMYGARSSLFFMATDRDIHRFRYNVEDVEGDLGEISDRGWEVGLHGGYYTYCDQREMMNEKSRLERVLNKRIIGYRNHYLQLKVPDTWELLWKAGFKYDSTLGYRNMAGFRNGMCHPFHPINTHNGTVIDILEIPLVVMDCAIFEEAKSFGEAWDIARRLIDVVEMNRGVITLLWHNDVFGSQFRKDWARLYNKILGYAWEKHAWMTSGEEVYKWWCGRDR